jgi:hypothetical protein
MNVGKGRTCREEETEGEGKGDARWAGVVFFLRWLDPRARNAAQYSRYSTVYTVQYSYGSSTTPSCAWRCSSAPLSAPPTPPNPPSTKYCMYSTLSTLSQFPIRSIVASRGWGLSQSALERHPVTYSNYLSVRNTLVARPSRNHLIRPGDCLKPTRRSKRAGEGKNTSRH